MDAAPLCQRRSLLQGAAFAIRVDDTLPPIPLDIPAEPASTYADNGWVSWGAGCSSRATDRKKLRREPAHDAPAAARFRRGRAGARRLIQRARR